jgi:hypothetical protein
LCGQAQLGFLDKHVQKSQSVNWERSKSMS